ncbi:unnamed protein product, partial [marine sediment metagenome]
AASKGTISPDQLESTRVVFEEKYPDQTDMLGEIDQMIAKAGQVETEGIREGLVPVGITGELARKDAEESARILEEQALMDEELRRSDAGAMLLAEQLAEEQERAVELEEAKISPTIEEAVKSVKDGIEKVQKEIEKREPESAKLTQLNFIEYMDSIGMDIDTYIDSPEEMRYYSDKYFKYREEIGSPVNQASDIEIVPGQTGLRNIKGELTGSIVIEGDVFGYASENIEVIVYPEGVSRSGEIHPAVVDVQEKSSVSPSGWLRSELSDEFNTLGEAI